MADAKRTKRVRDEAEGMSLEEHIAQRRLAPLRARGGAARGGGAEMEAEADAMGARWQHRLRRDLQRRAGALVAEADARESMTREHEFERTVVSYLRIYHRRAEGAPAVASATRQSDTIEAYVRHTDLAAQRRTVIFDEYLTQMNCAPAKVAMTARDECPRCAEGPKLLFCAARSVMSCPACGYSVTYLDATSSSTSFDEMIEFSQYSYKRINHYSMHLALIQGKESHRIADDVLRAVMDDLYDRVGVRAADEITPRRVRESLRRLKIRKAYDHVTQITARLSGRRPPRIPPETEEQLRNLFLQMQPAFQRHAPKTRTNFLSYSYVIYRSFQLLGLHEMLESVTLLKGRDKLEANDAIFRRCRRTSGGPSSTCRRPRRRRGEAHALDRIFSHWLSNQHAHQNIAPLPAPPLPARRSRSRRSRSRRSPHGRAHIGVQGVHTGRDGTAYGVAKAS